MNKDKLESLIPTIPFKGVAFKDIQGPLLHPDAFSFIIDELEKMFSLDSYDAILGLDARGFLFGPIMAMRQRKPFIMCRKVGKLPGEVFVVEYEKEYGPDTLCIEKTSVAKGQRVLIIDDLVATGGTALAAAQLIEKAGGIVVGAAFVIALDYLKGRVPLDKAGIENHSILEYPDFPKE